MQKLSKESTEGLGAEKEADPDAIRLTHDHLLNLLRDEAKDLEDPLLIHLYNMVIYRNRHGENIDVSGDTATK